MTNDESENLSEYHNFSYYREYNQFDGERQDEFIRFYCKNQASLKTFELLGPYEFPPLAEDSLQRITLHDRVNRSGNVFNGQVNAITRELDGIATYIWKHGSLYQGQWKDHKKHGQGRLIYANGDCYQGEFKADKKDGQGKYTFANGLEEYEGGWANDQEHGKG